MPCSDGGYPYPPSREEVLDAKAPAMLCAVIRLIGEAGLAVVMKEVDWKEAGVTRSEFKEWWTTHKKRDEQRREREAAIYSEQTKRKAALRKLTDEEKEILGITGE